MICHRCGNDDTAGPMWPDGIVDGEEQFLCQDCHEAALDDSWWQFGWQTSNGGWTFARQGDDDF